MVTALRRPVGRARGSPTERGYAAFLSYSHATDERLAGALQRDLQRFAKPWYRMRSLHVFRDQASLAANPALWPSIQHALRRSETFVLLACPASAASTWVQREIGYWLGHHGRDRFLIALTAGTIVWDREAAEFDWTRTDALPTLLRGVFADEPLHVDLRWAGGAEELSLHEARFLDCIASLAAPLHGRPREDLVGEDVRQHRRTVRLARAAVGSLAALAAAASVASVVAVAERNEARAERDRAEAQQRLATSRLLATQARVMLDERPDRALLLAAAAVRTSDDPDGRDALLRTLQRTANVTAYIEVASPVHSLAFSPDGRLLATGDQVGAAQLWDVGTASARGPPRTDLRLLVQALAFDPSGRTVISLDRDGAVVRWDTASGRTVGSPLGSGATQLAVHPDGAHLAAGDLNGSVAVWDLAAGEQVRAPVPWPDADSLTASVAQLAYSLDGRWLGARSFDGRVVVREAATFDVVLTAGGEGAVTSFAFSPDGRLLARGHADGSIALVELPEGQERAQDFSGHEGSVNSLAFAPDGHQLVSAGHDHTLRVWDVELGEPALAIRTAHGAPLTQVAYSADGQTLATAGRDGLVALWQLPDRLAEELFVEAGTLRSVAFAAGGDVAVFGHRDGGLFPWRLDGTSEAPEALPGSSAWTERLALTPDGRLAAAGDLSGRVRLWDLSAGRRLGPPLGSDGGRTLAHTLLAALKVDSDADLSDFTPLALSPDGSLLAAASFDNRIAVWSVDDARLREPLLEGHRGPVSSLAFSPDGGLLASGELTGDVLLWDARSGALLGEPLRAHSVGVRALAFSPDGTLMASGAGDGTVQLWRVADRAVIGEPLTGHSATVTLLAFSDDGARLASGDSYGSVRLWDVAAHRGLGGPFDWHVEAVRALAFTADGSALVSASREGTIRWLVDPDAWAALACEIANRELRPSEWDLLVGDGLPYVEVCDRPGS